MTVRRVRLGMTTLEIMVTLAIAGTFASMAVMNMNVVKSRQSERTALRQVSVMVGEARNFARTSQFPVRVSLIKKSATVTAMRWEQLPCDSADRWGNSCPTQACESAACGVGSCKCVAQGEDINIPTTLNLAPLNGLCWLGQGGVARYSAPSAPATCQSDGVAPSIPLKIFRTDTGKLDSVINVDPLTGKPGLIDCTTLPLNSKCL